MIIYRVCIVGVIFKNYPCMRYMMSTQNVRVSQGPGHEKAQESPPNEAGGVKINKASLKDGLRVMTNDRNNKKD